MCENTEYPPCLLWVEPLVDVGDWSGAALLSCVGHINDIYSNMDNISQYFMAVPLFSLPVKPIHRSPAIFTWPPLKRPHSIILVDIGRLL